MRGSVSRWDWRLEGMSCLPAIESVCVRVEPGRNGVAFSGFVKTHPSACFCSKRSHMWNWEVFLNCRDVISYTHNVTKLPTQKTV